MKSKIILFIIVCFSISIRTIGQTKFASLPISNNYVDCPSDTGTWVGGTLKMKVFVINQDSIALTIAKCNGSNFLGGGVFQIGFSPSFSSDNPNSFYKSLKTKAGIKEASIFLSKKELPNLETIEVLGAFVSATSSLTYYTGKIKIFSHKLLKGETIIYSSDSLDGISPAILYNNKIHFCVIRSHKDNSVPNYPDQASWNKIDLYNENGLVIPIYKTATAERFVDLKVSSKNELNICYRNPLGISYAFNGHLTKWNGSKLTDELYFKKANFGIENTLEFDLNKNPIIVSFSAAQYFLMMNSFDGLQWNAYQFSNFSEQYWSHRTLMVDSVLYCAGMNYNDQSNKTIDLFTIKNKEVINFENISEFSDGIYDMAVSKDTTIAILHSEYTSLTLALKKNDNVDYDELPYSSESALKAAVLYDKKNVPYVAVQNKDSIVVFEKKEGDWEVIYSNRQLIENNNIDWTRKPSLLFQNDSLHLIFADQRDVYNVNLDSQFVDNCGYFPYLAKDQISCSKREIQLQSNSFNSLQHTWHSLNSGQNFTGFTPTIYFQKTDTFLLTVNYPTCKAYDSVFVTQKIAALTAAPDQPEGKNDVCNTELNLKYSASQKNTTMGTQWVLEPKEAGTVLSYTDVSCIIDWNKSFSGGFTKLLAQNGNVCNEFSKSDRLSIAVHRCFTIDGVVISPDGKKVNNVIVQLWKNHIGKDTLSYVATSESTDGSFHFSNVRMDNYYLYAVPLSISKTKYIPTFYNFQSTTENATTLPVGWDLSDIKLKLCPVQDMDKGNGIINGSIKPMVGSDSINVVLYDENKRPIAWTSADKNGNFTFDHLPTSYYYVEISDPNKKNYNMIKVDLIQNNQAEVVTGVEDHLEQSLNLYPNPVSDILNINLPDNQIPFSIKILDLYGQVLKSYAFNENKTTIKLSVEDLNAGVYLCVLYFDNKFIVRSFVKT